MPLMVCHCGKEYNAREADLKRGWGYSCSKTCAANRRDFGAPKARRADGLEEVEQVKKSPCTRRPNDNRYINIRDNKHLYDDELGWDAHKR